jgi:hypothetical protein
MLDIKIENGEMRVSAENRPRYCQYDTVARVTVNIMVRSDAPTDAWNEVRAYVRDLLEVDTLVYEYLGSVLSPEAASYIDCSRKQEVAED